MKKVCIGLAERNLTYRRQETLNYLLFHFRWLRMSWIGNRTILMNHDIITNQPWELLLSFNVVPSSEMSNRMWLSWSFSLISNYLPLVWNCCGINLRSFFSDGNACFFRWERMFFQWECMFFFGENSSCGWLLHNCIYKHKDRLSILSLLWHTFHSACSLFKQSWVQKWILDILG